MTATRKRKGIYIALPILALIFLISTSMMSGTFAKYTSELAGKDTALVARWSFTGDTDGTTFGSTTTELGLFDHLYDTNMVDTVLEDRDGDGTEEEYYIIAPGVGDEFIINMSYDADVDALVTIDFTEVAGSADVPVQYSLDNGSTWLTFEELENGLASKIVADDLSGNITSLVDNTFVISNTAGGSAVDVSQTVKWQWAYEVDPAGNTADTILGNESQTSVDAGNGRTNYTLDFTITAAQIVPATD